MIEAEHRMSNLSATANVTEISAFNNTAITDDNIVISSKSSIKIADEQYLAVYAGVVSVFVVVSFAYPAHFYHVCTSASVRKVITIVQDPYNIFQTPAFRISL